LQIRKHGYFDELCFIILFVGILPLYAINLGAMSLFADSSITFLAMFVSDVRLFFGQVVARINLIRSISGVSGVRTPTPAYNNALSYQLSYAHGTYLMYSIDLNE